MEVTKGKKIFLAYIVQPFLTPAFSAKEAGEEAAATNLICFVFFLSTLDSRERIPAKGLLHGNLQ